MVALVYPWRMTTKKRHTLFVNIGVTPQTRTLVNAATARAGALVGRRVPNHQVIRAALAVAEAHPDEMTGHLVAEQPADE